MEVRRGLEETPEAVEAEEGGGGRRGGGGGGEEEGSHEDTYIYVVGVDVVGARVGEQRVHPDPVAII